MQIPPLEKGAASASERGILEAGIMARVKIPLSPLFQRGNGLANLIDLDFWIIALPK